MLDVTYCISCIFTVFLVLIFISFDPMEREAVFLTAKDKVLKWLPAEFWR